MGGDPQTVDAVKTKANISRGTAQRLRAGETSIGTEVLVAIASSFGIEVWELLQPAANARTPAKPGRSLAEALKTLAETLDALPESRRVEAGERLQLLAHAPDSVKVINGLHASLAAPVVLEDIEFANIS